LRVVTKDEILKIDEWAIKGIGIPRALLMENAGRSVAQCIVSEFGRVKRACVVAGKGNNGGDGSVCARHLSARGVEVQIFLLCKRAELSGDAAQNLELAEKVGVEINEITNLSKLEPALKESDVVVDSIFGVGFSGVVKDAFAEAIELINDAKSKKVVSVDVPSGLDVDSGSFGSHCVRANMTVTFSYPKAGLLLYPGIDFVGKLVVADIGIPRTNPVVKADAASAVPKGKTKIEMSDVIDADLVASKLPVRKASAHKGSCGEVFVLAGSEGMTGAAVLSSKSALRAGAGLVRAGVPEKLASNFDSVVPEVITVPLSQGSLAGKKILDNYRQSSAIAIGPGLSTQKDVVDLVKNVLRSIGREGRKIPVILDADGLNAIADDPGILKEVKSDVVITPHPGEMSRLVKKSISDVLSDRLGIAKDFSSRHGVVVVLKGARTLVVSPSGESWVNITGNPGMASAGMGDVLTGAIAGLAAQGLNSFDASLCAVFIHGMAGDVMASVKGERGLIASDLIDALPTVIRSIAC
jgi:NAD(P)H-hydrate epimerase